MRERCGSRPALAALPIAAFSRLISSFNAPTGRLSFASAFSRPIASARSNRSLARRSISD